MTAPVLEPVRAASDLPDAYAHWHWWHGQLVAKNLDDERGLHDTRFPITGGAHYGYAVGGRG